MKTALILVAILLSASSFVSSAHAGSCEEGWVLREDGMCEILSKPEWTDKTCNEWLDGDDWVWDDVNGTCVEKDKAPKKEKK